jgi:excisionase family DNA binding protein
MTVLYNKNEMLTFAQVARKLGRSYEHVRRLVEEGRLKAFQFGFSSTRYILKSEVEGLLRGIECG